MIGIFLDACHKLSVRTIFLSHSTQFRPVQTSQHAIFYAIRSILGHVTHVELIDRLSIPIRTIHNCACNVVIFKSLWQKKSAIKKKATDAAILPIGFEMSPMCSRIAHNWQWVNTTSITCDTYNFFFSLILGRLLYFSLGRFTLSSAARIVCLLGIHLKCVSCFKSQFCFFFHIAVVAVCLLHNSVLYFLI